jgi:formylglycine-generating enzyme required for sulfatase activity
MSHRLPPLPALAICTTLTSAALIGMPSVILAKPAPQVPRPPSALAAVVEAEGWTPAAPNGSLTAPGAVLVVDPLGLHTVMLSGCAPPAAMETRSLGGITGALFGRVKAAIEASPEWGGAGAAVPRTFVGLEQSSIGRDDLRPTEACVAELDLIAAVGGLNGAVLVSDALVASFDDGGQALVAYRSAPLSQFYDSKARAEGRPVLGAPADAAASTAAGRATTGGAGYAMRLVPAGRYAIGCTPGQGSACESDERPARSVTLSRSVWFGEAEVSQGLYARVTGRYPSRNVECGDDCPVEHVSWRDVVRFANALSAEEGLELCYVIGAVQVAWPKGPACTGYRLPTEAEWEVAARAGQDVLYAGSNDLSEVGWTLLESENRTHPAGTKRANAYGLADMSGNVGEWVWDWYLPEAYQSDIAVDPTGPSSGDERVVRGGDFRSSAEIARVARREAFPPEYKWKRIGFRLVRTASE